MENYTKGPVRELEFPCPFSLDETAVEMKVNVGSKIRNVMGYAMKKIKEPNVKTMTWTGSANGITKAVSCAEIMKKRVTGLHQITKITYRRIEESWNPKVEGLERLLVNRDVPAICILLSKEPLDVNEPGYQAPGTFDAFWKQYNISSEKSSRRKQPYARKSHLRSHLDKEPRRNDFKKGTSNTDHKVAKHTPKNTAATEKQDTKDSKS